MTFIVVDVQLWVGGDVWRGFLDPVILFRERLWTNGRPELSLGRCSLPMS